MRSYSVAVASLSIHAPTKWTDNLLAHHRLPEVPVNTRGVSRAIPWRGLVRVAVIREIHTRLGCGLREAVQLADALLRAPVLPLELGAGISIAIDLELLERTLHERVAEALETAPRPRRGRPRQRAGAPS